MDIYRAAKRRGKYPPHSPTLRSFFVFYGTATLFLEIIYSLVTSAKREAILFLFGCPEVNSTWVITSELANQRAKNTIHLCGIY